MNFQAFIGGSYRAAARTADDEQTINWYPEVVKSPGAPAQAMLLPVPGVEELGASTRNAVTPGAFLHPGRAHCFVAGREFAVMGDNLVEFSETGSRTYRNWGFAGRVGEGLEIDGNPATISYNGDGGNQLFITSGGYAYIFDLTTNDLTEVEDLRGKATMGDFLEGYFLCLDANTSTWYFSALFDGTSWTLGTNYAQRTVRADPWRALKVVGRYIWLYGETTSEVWYNTGAAFPFEMHPSGAIDYGVDAPWSVKVMGSDVVWLARTSTGRKCVLQASGFTPRLISNYPVEAALQGYDSVSDAIGDVYSEGGHVFYLLHCDRQGVTWVWDSETELWHQRGEWISTENAFNSWRPRHYAYAFDQHRMLDGAGRGLYRLSSEFSTNMDGNSIRRVRRAPALNNENKDVYYSSLEVDLERAPMFAIPPSSSSATDPQVMLRLSNDGGRTWIAELWRSSGKIGEYSKRIRWTRLGRARRRVFEVSVTDGIPWKLTGAYLEMETANG